VRFAWGATRPIRVSTAMISRAATPRAAYAFGILGSCSLQLQAQAHTSISLLQRTRPSYPVLALLSTNCSAAAPLHAELRRMGVHVLEVPSELSSIARRRCEARSKPLDARLDRRSSGYSYATIYDKLAIWNLTQYSAVMFLDSDLAVLRPLDHVLDQMLENPAIGHAFAQDGCFAINASRSAPYMRRNLGVWAVRPSAAIYRALRNLMLASHLPCDTTPVQSVARTFFEFNERQRARFAPFETLKLHQGHNMQANTNIRAGATSVVECLRKLGLTDSDLHVVHWSGSLKPAYYGERKVTDPLERPAFEQYRRAYQSSVLLLRPSAPR